MIALQVQNIEKSYVADPVISQASFTIQYGEKVGLIGPNGAGKSTLFRCLIGELKVDKGEIQIPNYLQMGYLEQRPSKIEECSLIDTVMMSFKDILILRESLSKMEEQMSVCPKNELETLYHTYAASVEEYEAIGGYSIESKAKGIIRGLGFEDKDFSRYIKTFSGGERNRIDLAKILVREPDILLLDEPTNHLDLKAIEWLENHLVNYKGSVFMISHDRYFLNQIVQRIIELNHGVTKSYSGNYNKYLVLKQNEVEQQRKAYRLQQEQIRKERAFIEKNRAGQLAKQARGRNTKLERIQLIEEVPKEKKIKLAKYELGKSPKIVLTLSKVSKGFGDKKLIHQASLKVERHHKIGLIGPNGCGKSTLLKLIMNELEPDEGQINFGTGVKVGYYDQQQSDLIDNKTVLEQAILSSNLDLPDLRDALARMMFYEEDLDKKIESLSGGEKARLSILLLLLKKPSFIIMDEPTNHLDIPSKMLVEEFLLDYQGPLLVVSHDRFFLDKISNQIVELEEQSLKIYLGNYSDYMAKKKELIWKKQREQEKVNSNIKRSSVTKKEKKPSKSKLKQELERQESAIHELERQLSEQHDEMQSVVQNQGEDVVQQYEKIGSIIYDLEEKLEEAYEKWTIAQEQLEEL